ncbi:hypothetical protein [Burkholderia vietnamiensis]|uniref:hypothetical protein n=1 Tax=Burkholderia vietnamiensis TaxID=60552 RepID=UPI001589C705|nr:hypothetical protein [Burkholderia vietnamiensis]
MKKLVLSLALTSIVTAAMADQAVVIKDTRSGTSHFGAPAAGELLTQQGQFCMLTEYKRTTDDPDKIALPIVDQSEFQCDAQGNRIKVADQSEAGASNRPDYFLTVDVLGVRRRVAVHVGKPIDLSEQVFFAYAGACMSKSDFTPIRNLIFSGGDGDAASKQAHEKAEKRPPHTPTSDESVELKSGAWKYHLAIVPSAIAADGSVKLQISGTASGPDNYNQTAANLCNGYKPEIVSEDIPVTGLEVHNGGIFPTKLLGAIQFRVDQL